MRPTGFKVAGTIGIQHYDAEDGELTKIERQGGRPMSAPTRTHHVGNRFKETRGKQLQGDPMRISLDWWAVLAAAVAVVLIKTGLVAGIPW